MSLTGLVPALLALQLPGLGGGTGAAFMFQIVAIFAIFYFLLIRPQQAQKKKHEASLKAIKRGDRIVTFGGIIAEVVHVKELETGGTMEDEITIRSAESRLIVERGRIARIVTGATGAVKE